jgi:hypothetical protein
VVAVRQSLTTTYEIHSWLAMEWRSEGGPGIITILLPTQSFLIGNAMDIKKGDIAIAFFHQKIIIKRLI